MQYNKIFKNTDELWLQQIPSHWDMIKTKYLFKERTEKGYPNEQLLVASQNMGVVPKGVYGNRTVEASKDLHLLKIVKIGDFVISLRSFQGGIEYAYYQGIISPAYTIMIPNEKIIPGYFKHLAKSKVFIELLQMCVTGIREGQNVDYSKLKNHRLPIPPLSEQTQISKYLDWQISMINKLIPYKDMSTYFSGNNSKLAKEMLLIAEYKTSLISSVVTGKIDVRHVIVPDFESEDEILKDETEALSGEIEAPEVDK